MLPKNVTATLADVGPDGWIVYHLKDDRGYTKRHDTVRIGPIIRQHGFAPRFDVQRMARGEWTHLLAGKGAGRAVEDDQALLDETIERAVAVMYGLEDHG